MSKAELAHSCQLLGRNQGVLFRASRVVLRAVLSKEIGCSPESVPLSFGKHGKPQVMNGPQFNVSHAGTMIVIAVHATCPIGVDIEPRARGLERTTMDLILTAAEMDRAKHKTLNPLERLRLWTRKEALVKATGSGLRTDLRQIEVGFHSFSSDTYVKIETPKTVDQSAIRLSLIDLELPSEYVGSMAIISNRNPPVPPVIERIDVGKLTALARTCEMINPQR